MSAASSSPARPTSTSKSASKVTTKKSAAAKPRAAPKIKATKADGRPSWKDIIKECIAVNKGDVRQGVSRNTIKRYAEEAYKIDVTGPNLSQLNRAITSGTEGGIFLLPKGPSGKIKLASKAKPLTSASKENSKPPASKAKTTTIKKAAAPPPAKKTVATPKKALAGKAKSTTTKKTTVPSKGGAAKKAITGSKPAAKAKSAATRKAGVKKAVSAKKQT